MSIIRRRTLSCVLMLPVLTAALKAQAQQETAVRTVVEALAASVAAKDVAALDTLHAHDPWVRVIEGAGINRGWVDYRDHHLKPELAEFENLRYRYCDVEPQVRGTRSDLQLPSWQRATDLNR